jgi:hypothetical protein
VQCLEGPLEAALPNDVLVSLQYSEEPSVARGAAANRLSARCAPVSCGTEERMMRKRMDER